ncbi:hypothetical protein CSA37_02190 [Candidatus Fermentibacteria bacterium]|nr:MAG: hypothetical protein CSA37_02190 [Candidatus Fermentibacteria bacterium]
MKYEAVVFDMDGTLLDSVPAITEIVNSVIAETGMEPKTEDEIRHAVGYGIEQLLRNIGVPESSIEILCEKVADSYEKSSADAISCFPGVERIIAEAEENGLKTAVLSNRPTEGLRQIVAEHMAHYGFQSVLGSAPGKPAKPDPEVLLQTGKVLGVKPEKLVMVGDGKPDIMAANSAGAEHVAVLWGNCTRDELESAGARNFAETPEDVIRFILQ